MKTYSHKFINSHGRSISTNHHWYDVKYNTEWEDLSLFPPNAIKIVKSKKVKKDSYSKQILGIFTFLNVSFYRFRINEMIDQILSETEYQ